MNEALENCFKKSNDNPDRFASCMIENQKKLTEITEAFQFKQLFLQNYLSKCLIKNDVDYCKNEGSKLLSGSINGLLKEV